jgi:hypothetical protein
LSFQILIMKTSVCRVGALMGGEWVKEGA